MAAKKKGSAKNVPLDLGRRLAALPAEAAQRPPSVPVHVLVREALDAAGAALKSRPLFLRLSSFEIRDLDDLRPLIDALEAAEMDWKRLQLASRGGAATKARVSAAGLRRELLAAGRYLLRKDPAAQAVLDDIAAGTGVLDLIEDLGRLAKLVDKHRALFASAPKLPSAPSALCRELAETLTYGEDRSEVDDALARRNQLAQALEGALSEVRAAARFLFRGDPTKLTAMVSHYGAGKARKNRRAAAARPAQDPKG